MKKVRTSLFCFESHFQTESALWLLRLKEFEKKPGITILCVLEADSPDNSCPIVDWRLYSLLYVVHPSVPLSVRPLFYAFFFTMLSLLSAQAFTI